MLLAREMPNMAGCLTGRSSAGPEKGREIVMRTLKLVQGHPKLIELADAQAADPQTLEKHLESAIGAWSGEEDQLDRFFARDKSQTAEDFLRVLTKWTQNVAQSLPQASESCFGFCVLWRTRTGWRRFVKTVWPEGWKALGLKKKMQQGWSRFWAASSRWCFVEPQLQGKLARYIIHPGVAQAGQEEVDEKFREAIDAQMASFWRAKFDEAQSGGAKSGQMIIMAGLRSAPYLMRQKMWSRPQSCWRRLSIGTILRKRWPRSCLCSGTLPRPLEEWIENSWTQEFWLGH